MMFKVPVVFAVDCVGSICGPPPAAVDVENTESVCEAV
jgi:hypothetical protein